MLTLDYAHEFADRWYRAWNSADLDAVMACYNDSIEHSSPFIARFNGTDDDTLRGKAAVRDYFSRALTRNPTPPGVTRFQPRTVAVGHTSIILTYQRMTGELAAEIFFLNAAGLIVRSVSHYGDAPSRQPA